MLWATATLTLVREAQRSLSADLGPGYRARGKEKERLCCQTAVTAVGPPVCPRSLAVAI